MNISTGVMKWVIQGLGLLALALLIWFAGPWLAFLASDLARWLAIAALLLIWAVWHLAAMTLALRKERQLIKDLTEEDPAKAEARQASAEKLAALRGGFEAAAQALQANPAKDKQGKRCLYEKPWYVIIGAPGTGKTTALANAGLRFPLAERIGAKPVKGVSGTRNCDWWFADEAVLLDTAGRYVTQDSHQAVDAEEWQGFLQLLKKYRPKRPLNGVLVASSLSDLLTQSEEERQRHAAALRRRVQELHDALGVKLPIYLLFTKTDLVAGFNDFFADLSQEEREQVWGETFPADNPSQPQNRLESFGLAYDELLSRLDLRTYKRVQEERDIQRRSLVLGFPQQMALLKPAILDFLQAVFAPNSYETTLLLRGVYFTCGTQEGNPIDRLMGILAGAFRLDRAVASPFTGPGKSFFLTNLLKKVIFPEAELAGVDPKIERRERLAQWGAWGAALAVTLGMVGLWGLSYGNNRSAIAKTDAQITLYHAADAVPADTRANFALLRIKLDALLETRNTWGEASWLAHFGLFQGDKLGSAADDAYERVLREYFLPAIVIRLQERLQTKPDALLLKAYRMFGQPDKFDAKTVEAVARADWEQIFNAEPDALASLATHLKNLLALKLDAVKLDENLKAAVMARLTQNSADQQCYDSFKTLKGGDHAHDFKLAEALKPNGQRAFIVADGRDIGVAVVPALYTAWGYREFVLAKSLNFVKDCMADNWVFDRPASASDPREINRLHEQFKALYLGEYAGYWRNLVNGIKLRPARNLHDTAELLDIVSRPDSPLRLLLVAVESNTALGKISAAVADAATKANLAPDEQTRNLINAAKEVAGMSSSSTGDPLAWMEKSFADLNALVRGSPAPLDAVLEQAKNLGNYFRQNGGGQAQKSAASQVGGGGDVAEQAKGEFSRLPEPLRTWLLSLTTAGVGATLSEAKGDLKDKAKSAGIAGTSSPCRSAFTGRYPFVRGSQQDAPLADFAKYFAPGGLFDQFFQVNLKDFIDTAVNPWRQKSTDGQSLGLSPDAIRQFQSATKIRDAFFPSGPSLQVQFDLKLLELSPLADTVHFYNEGQDTAFRTGQGQATRIQWPGPAAGTGVRITFETPDKQQAVLQKAGPWALFRLLEESSLQHSGGPERFTVSFQAQSLTARFELQASSVNNPFSLGEARNFHCPESL